MKASIKSLKIVMSLILLVIALLCSFNVSLAYFTANAEKNETIKFGDLNVRFSYRAIQGGGVQNIEGDVLELYSASGTIERGVPFQLSVTNGGDPIGAIVIQNTSNSCDCFVRFWIDAYIVDQYGEIIETTNYGKFFEVTDLISLVEKGNSTNNSAQTDSCYYYKRSLTTGESVNIITKLTLKDTLSESVPAQLLGEKVRLFVSFDTVQTANGAYLLEFNDEKGYLNSWS